MAPIRNTSGKMLLGKTAKYYTVPHLQRLLQEWGVIFRQNMTKTDLINECIKYEENHPEITIKDRATILNRELDEQHIRWQVKDDQHRLLLQAYPPDHQKVIVDTSRRVFAEVVQSLGPNPKKCHGCERFLQEVDFPNEIFRCCRKNPMHCHSNPVHCRSCIENHVRSNVSKDGSKSQVTCLVCNAVMKKHDVKLVTTLATYKMYKLAPRFAATYDQP